MLRAEHTQSILNLVHLGLKPDPARSISSLNLRALKFCSRRMKRTERARKYIRNSVFLKLSTLVNVNVAGVQHRHADPRQLSKWRKQIACGCSLQSVAGFRSI